MKDVIVSTKDDFIFKNKLYDEIAIKSVVKKEIDLFIFEENILIKEFENIKKAKEAIIGKIVREEYGDENDILIHYEHDKKSKKLYLYSMGNGRKIKNIISEAKSVRIRPIQFYIKTIVESKIKKLRDYIIIMELREFIYSIYVKENFIIKSFIKNRNDFILSNELNDLEEESVVIISKDDENIIPEKIKYKLHTISLEIGEIINEILLLLNIILLVFNIESISKGTDDDEYIPEPKQMYIEKEEIFKWINLYDGDSIEFKIINDVAEITYEKNKDIKKLEDLGIQVKKVTNYDDKKVVKVVYE